MERTGVKGVWKSITMAHGVLFAMTFGTLRMPMWYADNWTAGRVSVPLGVAVLERAWGASSWMT